MNKTIIIDSLKNNQDFDVSDNEEKTFFIFLTDGKDMEGKINIHIKGKKANAQILGIIIGAGTQKLHLYTYQDHQAQESVSDLLIKSVLFDNARLSYEGLIRIKKGAQKSNAYQKNQNILMSDGAWADSRPYLEILANDVRCTHGATVGKINPDEVYYLQTRGLTFNTAQSLIIRGFLVSVIDRVTDPEVRKSLTQMTDEKVAQMFSRIKFGTINNMSSFVKVGTKSDIGNGKLKEYSLRGKTITVANADGEYLAFDGLCTHTECALAGGYLDGYTLTCYCHGGQFDIKTGKVLSPPPTNPINIYKVKIEGENVLVEI